LGTRNPKDDNERLICKRKVRSAKRHDSPANSFCSRPVKSVRRQYK